MKIPFNLVIFAIMARIRKEWYIIVNPHAGSGKTMFQWIPAEKRLQELGIQFNTVFTTHKRHAEQLAAIAARQGYRRIMAVGGDGSIHEVFNGVVRWCEESGTDPSEFYLAVSPIGSGNDWIKAFGVPNDAFQVAELIAEESFSKQDIVKVVSDNGAKTTYMANIGGFGFDSHVCVRVNRQKEHGKRSNLIYVNALRYTIFHLHPVNVSFEADGKLIYSGKTLSMAMGTGPYSGGGMKQVCLADPSDGILDVLVVPKLSIGRILKEMPRLFKSTINESEYIYYLRCKTLKVIPLDDSSADVFELDGEIEGNLPLEISVLERQINVLCGKKSES